MNIFFELFVIFLPVLLVTLLLAYKVSKELTVLFSGKSDKSRGKNHFIKITGYFALTIYSIFLLFFVSFLVFFPQIKLPVILKIVGYIAYLFFWGMLACLPAFGHASGAGARSIQKNLQKFLAIFKE